MGRYPPANTSANLLIVEPDPTLAQFFETALADDECVETIHVTSSAETALEIVTEQDGDAPQPNLVVLDPHVERRGFEILSTLKDEPQLRPIPVVVLASSAAEEDVLRSYSLHANAYVQKPSDREELADLIESFRRFWLTSVRLPNPPF